MTGFYGLPVSTLTRPDLGVVLGGADCLADDLGALAEISGPWPGVVLACNDAGTAWPYRLDHWCSLHPEKFWELWPEGNDEHVGDWVAKRRANGHADGFELWSRREPEIVDHILLPWGGGSSSHYCLRVAEHVGVKRAILCGVPMTKRPHWTGARGGKPWPYADAHWKSWVRHMDKTDGWVRSMSGRTRDTFGPPDAAWLGITKGDEVG